MINSGYSWIQRILVATNLFGRGMDIERVNIVFNYDMPEDTDTYLHRVARAGRFGTKVTYKLNRTDHKTTWLGFDFCSRKTTLFLNFIVELFQGLAITFVSDETDAKTLNEVQDRFEVDISELPEEIDLSSYIEGR